MNSVKSNELMKKDAPCSVSGICKTIKLSKEELDAELRRLGIDPTKKPDPTQKKKFEKKEPKPKQFRCAYCGHEQNRGVVCDECGISGGMISQWEERGSEVEEVVSTLMCKLL